MTDHLLSEEAFPNVQSELPLMQLYTISTCPITGQQKQISTSPSAAPLEEVVDCDEVPAKPQPCPMQGSAERPALGSAKVWA